MMGTYYIGAYTCIYITHYTRSDGAEIESYPGGENPFTHGWHTELAEAPMLLENVPAGQSVHAIKTEDECNR
jgi:hypothetical protein